MPVLAAATDRTPSRVPWHLCYNRLIQVVLFSDRGVYDRGPELEANGVRVKPHMLKLAIDFQIIYITVHRDFPKRRRRSGTRDSANVLTFSSELVCSLNGK
jgi:hypothetical protein